MADTTISALTQALSAKMAGTAVIPLDDTDAVTKKSSLATLRTVMFAGGTGYTATDPITAGAASFTTLAASGNFAIATSKFTVAAASGNTVVAGTLAVGSGATVTGGTLRLGENSVANNSTSVTLAGSNSAVNWQIAVNSLSGGQFAIIPSTAGGGTTFTTAAFAISNAGAVSIASTLAVTGTSTLTGTVGIGTSALTYQGIRLVKTLTGDTAQIGMLSSITGDSGATGSGTAFYGKVASAAAAFTMAIGRAFFADVPTVGAASAITTQYAFYASNQGASGITNAYGVYIAAQSGAATLNIGLYNAGTSHLIGNVGIGKASTTTSPLCLSGIPTSAAGLASGDVWANSNVLTIVP